MANAAAGAAAIGESMFWPPPAPLAIGKGRKGEKVRHARFVWHVIRKGAADWYRPPCLKHAVVGYKKGTHGGNGEGATGRAMGKDGVRMGALRDRMFITLIHEGESVKNGHPCAK